MYLIKKHCFGCMENQIGNARYEKIIGYIKDEIDAQAWIDSQTDKTFKEWDGDVYPYYTKEKIEKVQI